LLKRFYPNNFKGRYLQPPPPIIINSNEEYEVEEILASKTVRGKPFYLIRWVGYGPEEDTWEPSENLEHCKGLLSRFHR
jgi:hypothetical protein